MEDREKERGREVSRAGPGRGQGERMFAGEGGPILLLLFILSLFAALLAHTLLVHVRYRAKTTHASFHVTVTIVLQSRFYSHLTDEKSERCPRSDINNNDCCLTTHLSS